ncbi:MAG: xanthine dehydrogenase family protein molybdopterin-binding subunit [Nitrospinae bacterium]|nr:xanthine dehydrogenase family protein molybdopterin-binding subunit [Nitrospinota bacterium]
MGQVVGMPVSRIDAVEKVLGSGPFAADIHLPGLLHGKLRLSDYAHARVISIDTSEAERLPGVKRVLSAWNTPAYRFGSEFQDQTLFARDKVLHRGSVVAAVAAIDPETAEEAVRRIRVRYEPLPVVMDVLDAIHPDAPLLHEGLATYPGVNSAHVHGNICAQSRVAWGDVEEGFRQADRIFEHTFTTGTIHQSYLEPMASVAHYEAGGKLTIWTSTQGTYVVRSRIASLLGIPQHKVRVIVLHVGGGFGGKLQTVLEPYCALLAQHTRRPVKIVLSREEEFFLGKPRSASIIHLKTGVTRDGTLTARQARMYFDTGFACHPRSTEIAPTVIRGPYNIPHVRFEAFCVYTNKMGCGSFRGPGGIQAHFAGESQIDIICRELGMDPVEFRRRNGVGEGGTSGAGVRLRHVGMLATVQRAAQTAAWGRPFTGRPGKRTGRGVACGEWRLGGGRGSGAWVKLNDDGTVHVVAGMTEIGSGSSTALAQIAAEVLGVGADAVALVCGDTETTPFDMLTAASRVTVSLGNAVKRAAADARDQVLQLAADRLEANPADLECRDGRIFVQGTPDRGLGLGELARYAQTLGPGPILGRGAFSSRIPQSLHTFGTQIVEVEVDEETGEVALTRIVAAHDVGCAINPQGVEGQIQGGVTQAIGHTLMEEVKYTPNGDPQNAGFLDYKIPSILDLPLIEPLIVEEADEEGPFGARGIGEPPILAMAPAIANAIYDAVGVRITSLPITAEKVLQALREKMATTDEHR